MQEFDLETGSLSGAQIAPVPLPLRKPERVSKVPNGKGAKANPATQKRMAQQKRAQPKADALSAIPNCNLVGVSVGRRAPRHASGRCGLGR